MIARGLWGSLLASAFAGLGVAGVLLASAALSGSDAGRMSLPLVSGGLGVGLILCAAMLLGQLGRSVRWSVAAVFAAAAAGLLISAADARAGTPEAAVTAAIAAILLTAGIIVTAAAPVLVGRLRWEALRDQSVRLSAVSGLALTGDMRMATARLGAPVSFGRRLRFAPTRRIALTLAIRDLLGLVRTPARSLAALLGVAVSGVVADAGIATGAALWAGLGGGAALLLAYASADASVTAAIALSREATLIIHSASQPRQRSRRFPDAPAIGRTSPAFTSVGPCGVRATTRPYNCGSSAHHPVSAAPEAGAQHLLVDLADWVARQSIRQSDGHGHFGLRQPLPAVLDEFGIP